MLLTEFICQGLCLIPFINYYSLRFFLSKVNINKQKRCFHFILLNFFKLLYLWHLLFILPILSLHFILHLKIFIVLLSYLSRLFKSRLGRRLFRGIWTCWWFLNFLFLNSIGIYHKGLFRRTNWLLLFFIILFQVNSSLLYLFNPFLFLSGLFQSLNILLHCFIFENLRRSFFKSERRQPLAIRGKSALFLVPFKFYFFSCPFNFTSFVVEFAHII